MASGYLFQALEMQVWRVTDTGIGVGQLDPLNLTPNTTSHAYRSFQLVSAPGFAPTFERVVFRSNQVIAGTASMGISDLPAQEVTVNGYDPNLIALLRGGSVDTTSLTNATISALNSLSIESNQVGIMFTGRIQLDRGAGALAGNNKYFHFIIPKATIDPQSPGLTQDGGTNPNTATLTINPQIAGTFPGGNAFDANQGWTDNAELAYFMMTDYPMSFTAFVQNGSATSYITGYLPVSNAVATGNTTNWFTVNGAVTAPTSISTSTGAVELAVAGTSGQIATSLYATNFQPIP